MEMCLLEIRSLTVINIQHELVLMFSVLFTCTLFIFYDASNTAAGFVIPVIREGRTRR